MTHREHPNDFELEAQAEAVASGSFQELLELLIDHGFERMAHAMQILFNEAMKLERSHVPLSRPGRILMPNESSAPFVVSASIS